VPPSELFGAVAEEVGRLLGADLAGMIRYETGDMVAAMAAWAAAGEHARVGGQWPLEEGDLGMTISRTGRAARIDDWGDVPGPIAAFVRHELRINSSVGSPIAVEGRVWGALIVHATETGVLPPDTESRLVNFTELVATAISNTTSRGELARLADEQAALRRVATLVARGVPPPEVFAAVAREVGQLLGVDAAHMGRYDLDGTACGVASWGTGSHVPIGTRSTLEGESVAALVSRTGRPARMHGYGDASGRGAALGREMGLRSSVGAPIVVDGRLWGVMVASSAREQPLPADTESRIAAFTELVATAISNTEARAEVGRLAEEQAALRRVATLVARQSAAGEVFAAVAAEVTRLLRVDDTKIYRFQDDATATVVAGWGEPESAIAVGTQVTLEGENLAALVFRTGRPARVDDDAKATSSLDAYAHEVGVRSAVGTPIVVDGRLWGAMVAASCHADPLAADTEARIGEFVELVATAISNIQARADLAASRARVVAAADDERRRVVRDLHDGGQQRLVHTVITLKLARHALEQEQETAPGLVGEALHQAELATAELRELAHGIRPAALTRGGLGPGVQALALQMPVPVETAVSVGRLPAAVEATAYFVVAEALTNVAKHARAGHAAVMARVEEGTLWVDVRDDGVGGARAEGSGLLGLADRLAVFDGRLRVESPAGGGTLVAAAIPLSGQPEESRR
jgi:signal transduction histidine kinase